MSADRCNVAMTVAPGPWLEADATGVGSPLELKFLRLFEHHGFKPEKQVAVARSEGWSPTFIADFAVPEKHLAVYMDGAAVPCQSKPPP